MSWAPSSSTELRPLASGLLGQQKRLFWVGFRALCWVLWTTRNKFTIEHIFPNRPADFLFEYVDLPVEWELLTKEADYDALEELISRVRTPASSLVQQHDVS